MKYPSAFSYVRSNHVERKRNRSAVPTTRVAAPRTLRRVGTSWCEVQR